MTTSGGMLLHPRAVTSLLQRRLATRSVTVLTGARQTGKTTLVREILPTLDPRPTVYISLDDPDERLRLAQDPVRRLDHGSRLVILDEVQKQPALLDAVKVLVDRRKGHKFLLLGSSHILLMHQVRETLAGRASLLDLWPFALCERVQSTAAPRIGLDAILEGGKRAVLDMASETPSAEVSRMWRGIWEQHVRWGGYPPLEELGEQDRSAWQRDFRRTYLERDLSDLGRVADLDQFALAQNLLACRTAQVLSLSEIARDLGVAVNTVKRYVRFLEISYQVTLLRPLLPNVTTRLVKSPKLYWTDPGFARMLSERGGASPGAIFETAVVDEVVRWSSWQPEPPTIGFYRTQVGREIDLLIASNDAVLGIEVKSSSKAHATDARALRETLPSLPLAGLAGSGWRLGLIVTQGREIRCIAEDIYEVPAVRLFGPAPLVWP